MKVLIYTAGSAGDTLPFIGIGRTLLDRGNHVVLFANELFANIVRGAGLTFVEAGNADDFHAAINNPDLWDARRGFEAAVRPFLAHLREWVGLIESHLDEDTVVVGSTLGFPARIVRDLHHVPLVLAHTAPVSFRSLHRMAKTEIMLFGDRAPMWAKSGWLRVVDWIADRAVGPQLNEVRAELNLDPVVRIFHDWLVYSPDITIGLFPDWFAPRQPDWPESLQLTGFPLWDGEEGSTIAPDLEAWLAAGSAPIVFTAGSANIHANEFFETATNICSRLGLRGLLINRSNDNIPDLLPPTVRHERFVPFSVVLPRTGALVSHGGIGTCAQGLAAGVPQLVCHINFDQRDNGSRIEDLGAGNSIPMRQFRDDRAASELERILDEQTALRAAELAKRVEPHEARANAANQIERAASWK